MQTKPCLWRKQLSHEGCLIPSDSHIQECLAPCLSAELWGHWQDLMTALTSLTRMAGSQRSEARVNPLHFCVRDYFLATETMNTVLSLFLYEHTSNVALTYGLLTLPLFPLLPLKNPGGVFWCTKNNPIHNFTRGLNSYTFFYKVKRPHTLCHRAVRHLHHILIKQVLNLMFPSDAISRIWLI